ncbi:MAG: Rha family transcriptional regulator [Magnetococcus sp. YQC-5]
MKKQVTTTPEIQLITTTGTPMVTSMTVAEKFGRLHKNVLQSIDGVKKECSEVFNRLNFKPVEYLDTKGEMRPMVEMTKDGFTMLMMRFTGPKAATWRERFIEAFNRMEQFINVEMQKKAKQSERRGELEWQANRATGKAVRSQMTDTIKVFVEYARSQGSQNASRYYGNFSKMVNTAILGEQANCNPNFRDTLDAGQLMFLAMGEKVAGQSLLEGMGAGLPYKACFQVARSQVTALGVMLGDVGKFPMLLGPGVSANALMMTNGKVA